MYKDDNSTLHETWQAPQTQVEEAPEWDDAPSPACSRCGEVLLIEANTLARDEGPVVFCPRCGWEEPLSSFESPRVLEVEAPRVLKEETPRALDEETPRVLEEENPRGLEEEPPRASEETEAPRGVEELPRVLEAALYYAALGYPVLPIEPGGKRPHHVTGRRGLTAADTNPHIIRAWFRTRPDANIAIVPPRGVAVLDFDTRDALEAFRKRFRSLEDAPYSFTPRGGHIWVAIPDGVELRSKPRGKGLPPFEVKKPQRGYVLEYPSKTQGGEYAWQVQLRRPEELTPLPPGLLKVLAVEPLHTKRGGASKEKFERILTRFEMEARPRNRHNSLVDRSAQLVHLGAPPEIFERLRDLALQSGLPADEVDGVLRWAEQIKVGDSDA